MLLQKIWCIVTWQRSRGQKIPKLAWRHLWMFPHLKWRCRLLLFPNCFLPCTNNFQNLHFWHFECSIEDFRFCFEIIVDHFRATFSVVGTKISAREIKRDIITRMGFTNLSLKLCLSVSLRTKKYGEKQDNLKKQVNFKNKGEILKCNFTL